MSTNNLKSIAEIKEKLHELYKASPIIHVDVLQKRRRVKNAMVKINGIYDYFVSLEADINNYIENFSITFVDVLTKNIIIRELEM